MLFSAINSCIYWYLYHYSSYINIRLLFKFFAISLLAEEGYMYFNSIILTYIMGDMMINYNEEYSILFFGIGHILFILNVLSINLLLIFVCTIPILYLSTLFICALLKTYNNNYYIYIYTLQLLLISSILNEHYGAIFFIISDICIGFKYFDKLDWPLYYLSIIQMRYWFIN